MLTNKLRKICISAICTAATMASILPGAVSAAASLTTSISDGARDIAVDTTFTVSTGNVDIDSSVAENDGVVLVNGSDELVEEIIFDDLDDSCSFTVDLAVLENSTKYTVELNVPLSDGDVAKKTISFVTESDYQVLASWEFDGDYTLLANEKDNGEAMTDGIKYGYNFVSAVAKDGILTIDRTGHSSESQLWLEPRTYENSDDIVKTSDIYCVLVRVRMNTEGGMKCYFKNDKQSTDKNFQNYGVPGDGKWHTVAVYCHEANWKNGGALKERFGVQPMGSSTKIEIDWVRLMGKPAKADTPTYIISNAAKNNFTANGTNSYDSSQKAVKCSGLQYSSDRSAYLNTSTVNRVVIRMKADKFFAFHLFSSNGWYALGSEALATKSFELPGDGQWHDIVINYTENDIKNAGAIKQLAIAPRTLTGEHTSTGEPATSDGEFWLESVKFYKAEEYSEELPEYNFAQIETTRRNGNVVSELAAGTNYSGSDLTLSLITAAYNSSNALEKVVIETKTVAAGRNLNENFSNELSDVSSDATVKTFLWNMENLQPIVNPLEKDEEATDDAEDLGTYVGYNGKLKVLILGNSYTYHAPATFDFNGDGVTDVTWTGNWGMAASSEDKDYVHVLQSYAQEKNMDVEFKIKNIAVMENNYQNYKEYLAEYAEEQEYNPDILIMSIGTNMHANNLGTLAESYEGMINAFKGTNTEQVICTMLLNTGDNRKTEMFKVAQENGYAWVDVTDRTSGEYLNTETYGQNAVGWHYGDNGMKMVADAIWNGRSYIDSDCLSSDALTVQLKGLKNFIPKK